MNAIFSALKISPYTHFTVIFVRTTMRPVLLPNTTTIRRKKTQTRCDNGDENDDETNHKKKWKRFALWLKELFVA